MAVVIQQMLDAEASGVVFTVNPLTGSAKEILVSAVWGLGEGLVSGALDADTFILDRQGRVISQTLVEKRERIDAAPNGGTMRSAVSDAQSTQPALNESQLAELARLCLQTECAAGRPQDVEFSVQDGRLYLLQARPVTGFTPREQIPHERCVWDNSNINESYPGITLPLTYSFIRHAYHAVYWQFCELIGLSRVETQGQDPMLWNMLGLIRGRVYYNLINWYKLVSLLPGFRFNKGFMETMMGLRQPEELKSRPACWKRRYFVELPRLVRTGMRAWWLHRTLPRRIRMFHREFADVHRDYAAVDFSRMGLHESWNVYRDLEKRVLWQWRAPIINDFEAMIFYGLLKRLTVAWGIDPNGSLQNALISGQGEIESTQLSERLVALAGQISTDLPFAAAFGAAPPEGAQQMLCGHPRFGLDFANYLDRYGDRSIEELKLESKTMKDDSTFTVAMLQSYLRTGVHARNGNGTVLNEVNDQAIELVRTRLNGRYLGQWSARRLVYGWVLDRARRAVRHRENQRLERTRAFGLLRRIFRSIGEHFAGAEMIQRPEDIFYLTLEEIEAAIQEGRTAELRCAVDGRRAQYDSFRAAPPLPDHFVTNEHPDQGCLSIRTEVNESAIAGKFDRASAYQELQGLGACPGVVERQAVVLERPDSSTKLDGEILVARQTDPGWVVLFPSIGGLIVERGSMLSHSAIVAREMRIPTVVGVRGAFTTIHTGDRVRLDGARGSVEIVPQRGG